MSAPDPAAAEAERVPEPSRPIQPRIETWTDGTVLYTCHDIRYGGAGFYAPPPDKKRTQRFSDFGEPLLPVLYAGETEQTAVAETLLSTAVAGSLLTRDQYIHRGLARISPNRDLRLAMVRGFGLGYLGLQPWQLTATPPLASVYRRTVEWAEAVHEDTDLDGLIWMSRPNNVHASLLLFGDRFADGDLSIENASRLFAQSADRDWLFDVCAEMGVTLLVG